MYENAHEVRIFPRRTRMTPVDSNVVVGKESKMDGTY